MFKEPQDEKLGQYKVTMRLVLTFFNIVSYLVYPRVKFGAFTMIYIATRIN